MLRLGFWMIIILLLNHVPVINMQSSAHFSTDFIRLSFGTEHNLRPAGMSPSGRYVAAFGYNRERRLGSNYEDYWVEVTLNIWDVHQLWDEMSFEYPSAMYSMSTIINIADIWQSIFSPDDRFGVVKTPDEIIVLTMPDLQLYKSYPGRFTPTWSSDGRLLALLNGSDREFIVWDIESEQVYTGSSEYTDYFRGRVRRLGDEWLINSDVGFITCTRFLEECHVYESSVWAYPIVDGAMIFTIPRSSRDQLLPEIWFRQVDGRYEIDPDMERLHRIYSDNSRYPIIRINPDGKYLFVSDHKNPPEIWDVTRLEAIQQLTTPHFEYADGNANWLANKCFFISDDLLTFRLYRIGEDEPLDVVDFRTIDEIYELIPSADLFHLHDASADGRWIMINLGDGIVVMQVVYE